MDDLQIFECVARAANGVRPVQIADWLDQEVDDVQARLSGLVEVGDLMAVPGISPAGQPCNYYHFSPEFKKGEVYERMTRKAEAANFTGAPGMTKIDRAIAFVRQKGVATSAELHALLELKPEQSASNWLSAALRDGRLVKYGKNWTIGTAQVKAPDAPAHDAPLRGSSFNRQALNPKKGGPVAQFSEGEAASAAASAAPAPIEVPKFKDQTVAAKPAPVPVQAVAVAADVDLSNVTIIGEVKVTGKVVGPASDVPAFRVGHWSDGKVELQRNGVTVDILDGEEAQHLAQFLIKSQLLPLLNAA